jgi:murein DD-endopeptidase MepM/ murein hydrolase activator NlpD
MTRFCTSTLAGFFSASAFLAAQTSPPTVSPKPAATPAPAQAPFAVSLTARSMQPGEVVMFTIIAPNSATRIDIRAFDQDWPAYRAEGNTWQALLGIDLDRAPGTYPVVITAGSGSTSAHVTRTLAVVAKKFLTRTLTVDDAYVNPPDTVMARINEEAARLTKLWQTVTPERLWTTPFVPPVPDPANSAFGSRSVFNGEARSPHTGADFLSPAGEDVKAPSAGTVVLAENLYFSGNTVILDHGLGLYSQFAHFSEIGVKVGDRVEPGQIVGKVGATGRVTGPHLHWAIRLNGARVDPLSLLVATAPKKSAKPTK